MALSAKKVQPKQMTSLDEKHTEMLDLFNENETETIPQLQVEIEELKTQINSLHKNQIELKLDLKDQISLGQFPIYFRLF